MSPAADALFEALRAAGVRILRESERELRRMSSLDSPPEIVVLVGPPTPTTLEGLMEADGIVLVLVGLRYPGNVGFILRSAEVAGAAGLVVATDWTGTQMEEALRVGMRADRFMPVLEAEAGSAASVARSAGRRLVALETSGRRAPWDADLTRPTVLFVGSETTGIPGAVLDSMDEIVRLPTDGFIPSYNVQAAVGMFLGEWTRQNAR